MFWSLRRRDRVFVVAAGATSFGGKPLPTEQVPPWDGHSCWAHSSRDSFGAITSRSSRQATCAASAGSPTFSAGRCSSGWLENGSAFDDFDTAKFRSNGGVGAILDTLIGPVLLGGSFSFSGDWRHDIGVGRLF